MLIVVLISLCIVAHSHAASVKAKDTEPWWKNGIIYQLYPRSFKDSDGNGIGDIKGILSKIDYIKDLGIDAVWLGPMYPSGGVDFGYDSTNMSAIDSLFGSLADLTTLINKLHDQGIKVIMDYVPNHTSDKHPWFEASKDPFHPDYEKYHDYYVWLEKPNNWISVMGGSAWTLEPVRNQFYLHSFFKGQPDLNYRNPKVVKDMLDIMQYWLDQGVNGFRMDAVSWLLEDEFLRNEPLKGGCRKNTVDYGCLNHIYTVELPETYQMIDTFSKVVNTVDYPDRVIFTESYNDDINKVIEYYNYGVTFPMNMRFIQYINQDSTSEDWKNIIFSWQNAENGLNSQYPSGPNWILGNHDQHRVGSRLWPELGDALNMLLMVLKGTVITYNGEEIVMVDGPVRQDQAKDIQGIKAGAGYYQAGRDGERTPFQWDSSVSGGFSDNANTWLPVNPDYVWNNVEAQKSNKNSHLEVYKAAAKLRKSEPALKYGHTKITTPNEKIFIIERFYDGNPSVYFLMNLGEEVENVNLVNKTLKVKVTSVNNHDLLSDTVNGQLIQLRPKAGAILTG